MRLLNKTYSVPTEISDSDSLSFISADIRITTDFISRTPYLSLIMSNQVETEIENGSKEYPDDFLIWNNPSQPPLETFKQNDPSPYIVLMKGVVKSLHVGRLNRVKITCESRNDAKLLIQSKLLVEKNFKVYIPNSIKYSRCLIKDIDSSVSVGGFVDRLQAEDVDRIVSICRRITFDKQMLESLEITFYGLSPPTNIIVSSFEFLLTSLSARPIRCFFCQRFRHTETQCKSTYSRCVFCLDSHEVNQYPNGLRRAICYGRHPAFSDQCLIYQRESKIQRIRAENGVGYQEAEEILRTQ